MKIKTIRFIPFLGLLLMSHASMAASTGPSTQTTIAQETEIRPLQIVNPAQATGIHIGDVLNRQIEVQVDPKYQISQQALPLHGLVRNGIELADIQIEPLKGKQAPGYLIKLRYRVFANAHVPAMMELPAESFALTGGTEALSIKLPAWPFWFSPLVPADIKNTKQHLIPQFKPTLIDQNMHRQRLAVLLALFLAGLAGLLYINADSRWLPFMNGAFARAHRQMKKLPRNQASEKEALSQLHQAFNRVHGANLFESDIADFLTKHPQYSKLGRDIEQFFQRSSQTLFSEWNHDSAQFIGELISLSKRLRDCERRAS